jgi:hypothetical protein
MYGQAAWLIRGGQCNSHKMVNLDRAATIEFGRLVDSGILDIWLEALDPRSHDVIKRR